MTIRIGNDIKLNVTLDSEKDFNTSNVYSIKAYLINLAAEEFFEPMNPCHCNCCHSVCGHCGYHHYPSNLYNRHSVYFDDWGCCHPRAYGRNIHRLPFLTRAAHHGAFYRYLYNATLKGNNTFDVFFPAKDQRFQGTYKLIVVLTTQETGWGEQNLHTYTIDYGEVFTLTADNDGVDADVTINVTRDHGTDSVEPQDSMTVSGYVGTLPIRPLEANGYYGHDQSFEADEEDTEEMMEGAENVDLTQLVMYPKLDGTHSVSTGTGGFLWIVTNKPVEQVSVGTFEVPLSDPEVLNGLYYYAGLNHLQSGATFNLTIKR